MAWSEQAANAVGRSVFGLKGEGGGSEEEAEAGAKPSAFGAVDVGRSLARPLSPSLLLWVIYILGSEDGARSFACSLEERKVQVSDQQFLHFCARYPLPVSYGYGLQVPYNMATLLKQTVTEHLG